MAAETVHNVPSILVSELYARGAPRRDASVERELPTGEGVLKALLVPGDDYVTSVVIWPARSMRPGDRVERGAEVEWQRWQFESRRPWILCEWCTKRCSRIFLSTHELPGSLLCKNCAGVRYRSQNYNPRERLLVQRDKILEELGGEAAGGEVRVRVPLRRKGMHYRRYDALVYELDQIQDRLELDREKVLARAADHALALALRADKAMRRTRGA